MQKKLTQVLFVICVLVSGVLSAQIPTPFWTENFTNGFPTGWSTEDASTNPTNVLWSWCNNPANGAGGGCPPIFNDGINLQEPFSASTATTGFLTLDSDSPQQQATNHIARLKTTAITCTNKNEVWIKFQSHIGVYTVPATTGAILQVSTNNTTWTDYTLYPELTTAVRWSKNPEINIVDISATAANQATVFLRWQWTGNWEYFWNIDDVEIYSENPTPKYDLELANFFYPASSFATPKSQIATDTFGFYAYLSNKGLNPMTNVVLKATVTDEGNGGAVLFADSITIPSIAVGVKDSLFALDNLYVPALDEGEYQVNYTLRGAQADQFTPDNAGSSPFVVTDFVFSKEAAAQSFTRTSQDIAWAAGNYYRMSDDLQEQYQALTADFAFDTDEAELPIADVKSTVLLLKVNDDVPANFAGFDIAELFSASTTWVGLADYAAPVGITGGALQTVILQDLNSGAPGILLEPGGRYFLMSSYGDDVRQTNHAFNRDITYLDVISSVIYTDQWYLGGFGDDFTAVMRMGIGLVSTTDEKPLAASAFRVFPNPTGSNINLAVQFDQPTDATITIAQLDGRVVTYSNHKGITSDLINFNLPSLANGIYLARIATPNGTSTQRFVVQK